MVYSDKEILYNNVILQSTAKYNNMNDYYRYSVE